MTDEPSLGPRRSESAENRHMKPPPPPIPLEVLQAAQDAADRAAYDRAANADELRAHALRLRGLDAMHNWAFAHPLVTEADVDDMASRLSIGYGVPAEELREVAMRIYRDPGR